MIVVGSGAGALTGALAAAGDGLDTVVLERTAPLGGTSAYSGPAGCPAPRCGNGPASTTPPRRPGTICGP
ncbi:FAD-binding protein [Streptomyces brevispora]|uniref:FAD-binding protein n=1 Tax=Streptomyces brevispora TaxID=887462 RepID=UPI003716A4A1